MHCDFLKVWWFVVWCLFVFKGWERMVLKVRHWESLSVWPGASFFFFLICLLPACPVYLDSIDRDLQAFSAWCFQHNKAWSWLGSSGINVEQVILIFQQVLSLHTKQDPICKGSFMKVIKEQHALAHMEGNSKILSLKASRWSARSCWLFHSMSAARCTLPVFQNWALKSYCTTNSSPVFMKWCH